VRPNEQYSDKEIAIFNGIVELLDQGRQIHELKISDISAAAGIGKSTAYEYFSSKEELLRKATRYHVIREYEALRSFVAGHQDFWTCLSRHWTMW
jgi:AcrR family transcriptional regulator